MGSWKRKKKRNVGDLKKKGGCKTKRKKRSAEERTKTEKQGNKNRELRTLEMEAELTRQKEAAKREHEVELARLAAANGGGHTAERDDRAKAQKPLAFVYGKDDLFAYLQRFERFADTAKWHKTGWASKLSALLSG